MDLLVASVGVLSGAVEAVAASIGSGLVVGGFFGGLEGGLSRRPARKLDRRAVFGSYIGGLFSLTAFTVDIVEKHFV